MRTLTEQHDFQRQPQIGPLHRNHPEPSQYVAGQRRNARHVQQESIRVPGRHRHAGRHQAEERSGRTQLDVVPLQLDGGLALAEGVHDGGHEAGEHAEGGGGELVGVVEAHPAPGGGEALEGVVQLRAVHVRRAAEDVQRLAEAPRQLAHRLELTALLDNTERESYVI